MKQLASTLTNNQLSPYITWFYNKRAQMGNNLAQQQVNNNNKAKTKQQTQEQLSSSLSQILKAYDFGNLRIVS